MDSALNLNIGVGSSLLAVLYHLDVHALDLVAFRFGGFVFDDIGALKTDHSVRFKTEIFRGRIERKVLFFDIEFFCKGCLVGAGSLFLRIIFNLDDVFRSVGIVIYDEF